MPTEVWFRNPHNYIRELVECGQAHIAWQRGTLLKRRIDPHKHAKLYFGELPFRLLLVGDQGTAELDNDHDIKNPKAVYPTWTYGEELHVLENYLAYPVGEDERVCSTKGVAPDELPVLGQEHRVIITGLPPGNLSFGRAVLRKIKELQEDYPHAIVHLHGPYGWSVAFGSGVRSADVEPRTGAQKGKVTLPSGSEVAYERTFSKADWVKLLGYHPADLKSPRERCMFNILSAVWAGEHFAEQFAFRKYVSAAPIDTSTPDAGFVKPTTKVIVSSKAVVKPGDKFTCNTCSLMDHCKYFREGAVCSVPDAEPAPLTKYFNTRDSGQILDGLAILMKSGVKRYERGIQEEMVVGEIIPEVTKMQSALFEQGVKLAKLVDPALRTGAGVQVNVGGGSAVQVNSGSPRQLIAQAMRELEARGIAREDITPKLIEGVLTGMTQPETAQRAIEHTVIEHKERG